MELLEFYRDWLHLTDPAVLQQAMAVTEVRVLPRGTRLLRTGEIPTHMMFLMEGTTRGMLTDKSGRETTVCIQSQPASPVMPSVDFDGPSPTDMETLLPSTIAFIPLRDFYRLLEQYPALQTLYAQVAGKALQYHLDLKTAICQLEAQERYLWYCAAYPDHIGRIPQKYIASLLNMTPVSLSRVRRALREQKKGQE